MSFVSTPPALTLLTISAQWLALLAINGVCWYDDRISVLEEWGPNYLFQRFLFFSHLLLLLSLSLSCSFGSVVYLAQLQSYETAESTTMYRRTNKYYMLVKKPEITQVIASLSFLSNSAFENNHRSKLLIYAHSFLYNCETLNTLLYFEKNQLESQF